MSKTQFDVKVRTQLKRKTKTFTFFGAFGLGNFGNEITLKVMLYHLLHFVPEVEVNCICTDPAITAATHRIKCIPISRVAAKAWRPRNRLLRILRSIFIGMPNELYRWLEALLTLKHTDVLVVPGTGLLTDAYGLRGWGPYSIFKWALIAKMRGCKVLFVSVGVGPVYSRIGRFFVKTALSVADFRSYRDRSTRRYLEGIGFRTENDRVYPDLVFSLPWTVTPCGRPDKGRRLVVGLGLMEDSGKYCVETPTDAIYGLYLTTLVELVRWLIAHEYSVRLLIGDLADRRVTREFRSLLKECVVMDDEERIIDEPIESVEDLLSQLEATDFVVGTRFHNVLLALLLNKPSIAISFHHKCSSLMSQMGLSEYCQDIKQLNGDRLIEQFCQLERNAGRLRDMISEKVAGCRIALDEQYGLIFKDYYCRTPGTNHDELAGGSSSWTENEAS